MPASTIRVIFDTNIYFALIAFKNRALQDFFFSIKSNRQIQIIYSAHIKEELIRNLQDKKYTFSEKAIDYLFKGMELATVSLDKTRQPESLRDKADWHLFALAHFSEAAYLVSGDGDILSFKPRWGKTKIMKLREFSEEIEKLLIDGKL